MDKWLGEGWMDRSVDGWMNVKRHDLLSPCSGEIKYVK